MNTSILVLNAGSSSLKFAVYAVDLSQNVNAEYSLTVLLKGQIADLHSVPQFSVRDGDGRALAAPELSAGQGSALDCLLAYLLARGQSFDLVGHRVVHGGVHYSKAVLVNAPVQSALQDLVSLAPLHQPHNLLAIERLAQMYPHLPQVACFDTAFHRSNADLVQRYALPDALHQQGILRYGFHGLSYTYISGVLANYDKRAAQGKTIVLHLGNGASLCAFDAGISVTSSMGFSAVDGIPMATRCGALDPGVILHLLRAHGMDADAIEALLYRQSGLLGVSGVSGDMRVLSASNEPMAETAIALFVYRIVREVGSLMAALGGLHALVFTAGIGENASHIRERIVAQLHWLGVRIDANANLSHGPRISAIDSAISVWVIPTDEEKIIAQQALAAAYAVAR